MIILVAMKMTMIILKVMMATRRWWSYSCKSSKSLVATTNYNCPLQKKLLFDNYLFFSSKKYHYSSTSTESVVATPNYNCPVQNTLPGHPVPTPPVVMNILYGFNDVYDGRGHDNNITFRNPSQVKNSSISVKEGPTT